MIDSDGKNVGVKPLREALSMAQQRGLDLVEIAPNATPPVCRMLEYGKFRYEQTKRERESRKHTATSKVKQVKFHVNISEHDYQMKLRQIEGFLEKHMKTKVSLMFRGREMAHQELGDQLMKRLAKDLDGHGQVETAAKLIGRIIHMVISPISGKHAKTHHAPAAAPGEAGRAEAARAMAVEVKFTPSPTPLPPPVQVRPSGDRPAPGSGPGLNTLEAAFNKAQSQK